jgi:hypothetical protein
MCRDYDVLSGRCLELNPDSRVITIRLTEIVDGPNAKIHKVPYKISRELGVKA